MKKYSNVGLNVGLNILVIVVFYLLLNNSIMEVSKSINRNQNEEIMKKLIYSMQSIETSQAKIIDEITDLIRKSEGSNSIIAEQAMKLADESMEKSNYRTANEFLIIAIRNDPGNLKVFEKVIDFIEYSEEVEHEDIEWIRDEMLDRANAMVSFLPLNKIEEYREKVDNFSKDFTEKLIPDIQTDNDSAVLGDIFYESKQLVGKISANTLPIEIMMQLLENSRNMANQVYIMALDDFTSTDARSEINLAREETLAIIEKEELKILSKLFNERKSKYDEWLKEVISPKDSVENFIEKGHAHLAEIETFKSIESNDLKEDISDYKSRINKGIVEIERSDRWKNNQKAIEIIRSIDESNNIDTLNKLKELASINEHLLDQYFFQRMQQSWDKYFEKLSEDEKIEAIKYRILKEYYK